MVQGCPVNAEVINIAVEEMGLIARTYYECRSGITQIILAVRCLVLQAAVDVDTTLLFFDVTDSGNMNPFA